MPLVFQQLCYCFSNGAGGAYNNNSHLVLIYGLVEKMLASLTNIRRLSFNCAIINSAKSSGCITLSGSPVIKLALCARSVTMVLGAKAVTLMLCLRTSCIRLSLK